MSSLQLISTQFNKTLTLNKNITQYPNHQIKKLKINNQQINMQQKFYKRNLKCFSSLSSSDDDLDDEDSKKNKKRDKEEISKGNKIESFNKEENNSIINEDTIEPWSESEEFDISNIKAILLAEIAGLDRGFSATPKRVARVRELTEKLETLKGTPDLTRGYSEGLWRLIFTSGFTSQNVGGFRPGPLRQNLSPFSLGQVFQRIDWSTNTLENILELYLSNVPRVPWLASNLIPTIKVTLEYEFTSISASISLKSRQVKVALIDSGFDISSNELILPSFLGILRTFSGRASDGEFSVIYLDESLRITEGDLGEVRIFIKE